VTEAVSHNAIMCVCLCVVCNENFGSLFILPLELGACILLSLLLMKFGING